MSLAFFKDFDCTDPITPSNPDRDNFDGELGETLDGQIYLANEQITLAQDLDASATTVHIPQPRFEDGMAIVVGNEQMKILSGGGTLALGVERGFSGTQPAAHLSGVTIFSGYDYTSVRVFITDTAGTDESVWIQLAIDSAGLDSAVPGAELLLPDKPHNVTHTIWRRVTVPANSPVQNKTDLAYNATAMGNPIL